MGRLRPLLTALLMAALPPVWSYAGNPAGGAGAPDIFDMPSAMEYCRQAPLASVEGIWEFPEDATRVLIRRQSADPRAYDLILLSSPDCRLIPGETIGHLEETAETSKFRLSLFCDRRKGLLTDLRNCAAEFSDREGTMRISGRKIKLSIRSTRFLPQFWRLLGISVKDPAGELPLGLIRIFPDARNGGSRDPIYL